MSHFVLASRNQGKLHEMTAILQSSMPALTLSLLSDFTPHDAEETGLSFIENAILKARHASKHAGLPAIADDSGLCVPLLGGEPGLYSARYAGTHGNDAANNMHLLQKLAPFHQKKQSVDAFFICIIAIVQHEYDPTPCIFEGRWNGILLDVPRGNAGFGYDPLFFISELNKTSAELPPDIKNMHSHRAKALKQMTSHFDTILKTSTNTLF